LFYITDGAALLKNGAKALGKLLAKRAAKKAATTIVKEVAELSENKINHILQEHHDWAKVVSNPNSWDEVSKVMSKVMTDGVEGTYKSVNMKALKIGDETVVVTYKKFPDGTVKISDGWVLRND
jgi:Zn-dependent oligopeptidase